MSNSVQDNLEKTFEKLNKYGNETKLEEFKELMENMYLKGLRDLPTFSEEMHKKIEEEFQKMYKEAEKYLK